MKRREFVVLIGGALAAFPFKGFAQEVRQIGLISPLPENDPGSKATAEAFQKRLEELGWVDGRNIKITFKWGGNDDRKINGLVQELIGLRPDVIVGRTSAIIQVLQKATRTTPIIFTQVVDAVRQGFVASLSRPGANITGFASFEPRVGGKWLELLKAAQPSLKRTAILYHPPSAPYIDYFLGSIYSAADQLKITLSNLPFHNSEELSQKIGDFAKGGHGGVVVIPDAGTAGHRKAIIEAINNNRLPAVYPFRYFVDDGGLMYYGTDPVDTFREAAGYVDQILRGKTVAELPVQFPTSYRRVINLKTAKATGIEIPMEVQLLADALIE